jgi:hypothetical protein
MTPHRLELDFRYDCALAAAQLICHLFARSPSEPPHALLAKTVYSILEAMERYERGGGD